MPLPELVRLPRVIQEMDALLNFVSQHPWGNPQARAKELDRAMLAICQGPELDDICVRRRDSGVELRRHNVGQFAIIYAYFPPTIDHPQGIVSIRAIKHSRQKDVFRGVREMPDGIWFSRKKNF